MKILKKTFQIQDMGGEGEGGAGAGGGGSENCQPSCSILERIIALMKVSTNMIHTSKY